MNYHFLSLFPTLSFSQVTLESILGKKKKKGGSNLIWLLTIQKRRRWRVTTRSPSLVSWRAWTKRSDSQVAEKEMKASAISSSLLSSNTLNLHLSSSFLSRSLRSSKLFFTFLPSLSPPTPNHNHNRIHLSHKFQFHTASSPIMASSFNPERARSPPAIPMPAPPVTKVTYCLF